MWGSSWEEITAAAGGGRGEWGEGVSGKVNINYVFVAPL